MKSYNTNSQAYVLPIVLFMVIILISGALFALHIAKQDIDNTARLVDTAQAQLEAESQLEVIKFYAASGHFIPNRIDNNALISTTPSYPESLYLDNREHNITANLSIHLQDTAGLLNATHPDATTIATLLDNTNKFDTISTLEDSISDWYDSDDFHRTNGAEENYYREQHMAYGPRNTLISQSVDELRLIRGIHDLSEAQWNYLRQFLISTPSSDFNVMTAPPQILAAKLRLPLKELEGLTQLRKRDPDDFLQRIALISTQYNNETMGSFPSKYILVHITATRNNAKITLKALIDCNEQGGAPGQTIRRY